MKINPALLIAIVGAAAAWFYWQQTQKTGTARAALQPGQTPPLYTGPVLEYGDVGEETYTAF